MEATISADIIKSTSLSKEGVVLLQRQLQDFTALVNMNFMGCWGRVVRGDGLEFAISDPHYLLRIVLLLQCHLKTLKLKFSEIKTDGVDNRFFQLGARMAIAIGQLRTNDRDLGIIDGDAIYKSGRALEKMRASNVFSITTDNMATAHIVRSLFLLTHHILKRATARQCAVMFMKLLGKSNSEIAGQMHISRVGVYLHLQIVGWDAIAEALECYEQLDFG